MKTKEKRYKTMTTATITYYPIEYHELVNEVEQYKISEVSFVISYLIGRCGVITPDIWDMIKKLVTDGFIKY